MIQRYLLFGGIAFSFPYLCRAQQGSSPGEPFMEDIRDIMVKPPGNNTTEFFVASVVLLAAGIVGIIAARKFMANQPGVEAPPPEIVAKQRLKQISEQVEELPPNKASLETSEAVKDFLTARYSDPIRYETAEEYLNRISALTEEGLKSGLTPAMLEEVRSFMAISQELKFAQLKEARSRIPALIEQAEMIIAMSAQDPA